MPLVTISREAAVQRCPVEKNALLTAHSTATFRSASSRITSGFLPPISSWNFFIGRDATQAAATLWPVTTEPVKLIAATSGCSSSAAPTSEPRPITRLSTPLGRPARCRISTSAQVEAGLRRRARPCRECRLGGGNGGIGLGAGAAHGLADDIIGIRRIDVARARPIGHPLAVDQIVEHQHDVVSLLLCPIIAPSFYA